MFTEVKAMDSKGIFLKHYRQAYMCFGYFVKQEIQVVNDFSSI